MKRLIILQLLSIIFMVLGLAALLYYQKLTKLEEQEKTKSKKKTYQRKEIICFYLGLILEVIGLILLMFI
ncbi:MAG: hypothetical protein MSS28_01165 [Tenericutes bacterium]|nr:hypothetical protein [Mycoplasmatota bacterium]